MEKFKKIDALTLCKDILEGMSKEGAIKSAIIIKKLLQNNKWDSYIVEGTDPEINYIYSVLLAKDVIDYFI